MLIALWLVGWTLRVPILSAPPLATRIADSFGLNEAGVGAITMLPVIAIAFGAIPAALVIARFGIRIAITGGLLIMAAASVARGYVPSSAMLFTVTVIMGLGVAVFQTALPAAARKWTPTHVVLGSAVYLNGMMFGELSGAGLTLPLALPLADGDWRMALVLWAIPIVLIAALVAFMRVPKAENGAAEAETNWAAVRKALPRWNDGRVWQYGILLAGSTVVFFVINAYAGSLLRVRGESEALGNLLLAFNTTPLLASFIVLAAPKWVGARGPIAISAILSALGLAGFTFLEGWASWGAAMVVGLATTVELILIMSLPVKIASGIAVTRLSAGITLVGLTIAFALPILGGWLADSMENTELALLPSLIFSFALLPAVGRKRLYPKYG